MPLRDGLKDGWPKKRALAGWFLYDWANSAFPTLIVTFVFAVYFTQAIAETPEKGTALWGTATGLTAFAIAILAPVLGAIADAGGRLKPWIFCFTLLCALATAGLRFATPGADSIPLALLLVGLGIFGFELGMVFYNAMLPKLGPPEKLGRISGWGWGVGYIGGLSALALSLLAFVLPEEPWFGVGTENAANIRAVPVLAGFWILIFALPLFVLTPDRHGSSPPPLAAARQGLQTLWRTVRELPRYKTVFRYLIARMLYTDGLNTLFAFGGIYAAAAFGMEQKEVLMFGIALNVTAGLGALGFAFLDDSWGSKPVILTAVGAITAIGAGMLLVEDKTLFWGLGLALGAFLGPAQAASRTLMARLAPEEMTTEFFGLYALSGKITAFLGPMLLGWITLATDSQRIGMATVLIFLIAGWLLLAGLRVPAVGETEK